MPAMTDPLPSWRDTATLGAIVAFVESVTRTGGAGFVPPEERVATFDNDGTLWCEKPTPIELGFILRRLAAMADRTRPCATASPGRPPTTRTTAGWATSSPSTTTATTAT